MRFMVISAFCWLPGGRLLHIYSRDGATFCGQLVVTKDNVSTLHEMKIEIVKIVFIFQLVCIPGSVGQAENK